MKNKKHIFTTLKEKLKADIYACELKTSRQGNYLTIKDRKNSIYVLLYASSTNNWFLIDEVYISNRADATTTRKLVQIISEVLR